MIYDCCDQRRRNAVAAHPLLNGIDYLEVLDRDAPVAGTRQRTLLVRLLKPVPDGISLDNVAITGGERIKNPSIHWVAAANNLDPALASAEEIEQLSNTDQADQLLVVRTFSIGDFSDYCLRLQASEQDLSAPDDFDPLLVAVNFSFKVECPSDFDCEPQTNCTPQTPVEPDINYLARDYNSFRQLILDRLNKLVPNWQQHSVADTGVMLTEMLAYVADQLSYWQDAVDTEAYLGTARRRTSLRRHALLVDYPIGEGRNARSWLHVNVSEESVTLIKNQTLFLTAVEGLPVQITPDTKDEAQARQQAPLVFEPMSDAALFSQHNEMLFYTWGDSRCCLNKGATAATLREHFPNLSNGDFLLLEEVLGPITGAAADADPAKRHIVRLTQVLLTQDPLDNQPITQIHWQPADALPFALCISSQTDSQHEQNLLNDVSVARANLVLVDHGETIVNENLGQVPSPHLYYPVAKDSSHCEAVDQQAIPARFRPKLKLAPLVFAAPAPNFDAAMDNASADYLIPDQQSVLAAIVNLESNDGVQTRFWQVRSNLLNSAGDDDHFVVETEHDGSAYLRFGDDVHGRRPEPDTQFTATYRIGGGVAGNVGAGAIAHIISNEAGIVSVRNPLPAAGGLEPETAQQIRRRAPLAFRSQQRAVTAEDYAKVSGQFSDVQQAAATMRWTGSWHTVFITVDRQGGELLDSQYEARLADYVERYRMAGQDLEFNDPVFVSLEMDMRICVERDYFRSDVKQALLSVLTSGWQPSGQPGLFHPDNFSFAQTIYLSPFYAAARQVAGVASVDITRFQRRGDDDPKPLADGYIRMGRLEIARLYNDRNFPEHGVLRLQMLGGK